MRKYKFTDNEKIVEGHTVRQIRALVDIPQHGIEAGDLGGWQITENLSHDGDAWLCEEAVLLNSKVQGDTLIRRGTIADSEVNARLIACKSIINSKVDGEGIAIRHSAVVEDSTLTTTGDMEISSGAVIVESKVTGSGYIYFGEDTSSVRVEIMGSQLQIEGESTVEGGRIEGKYIKIQQASKLKQVRIKAEYIELSHCDFEDLKIEGEGMSFLRVKFHKGKIKANSLDVNYGWDIFNTHLEGEKIRMDSMGESVLHNASIHCTGLKMIGDFNIDWVFFRGKNIELDGIVRLKGFYESMLNHFQIEENVKILGTIEMEMSKKPIKLKDEIIEGDFKYVS